MYLNPLLTRAETGLHIQPGSTLDLGSFPAECQQIASFTVSNISTDVLRIEKLESCCAFLDPILYESSLNPGDSTPLDVIVDAHALNGPFKKQITLVTAEPVKHRIPLWIKGTAEPAISIPTVYVFAGHIALNDAWSTNLPVTVRHGLSTKLISTIQSNTGMDTELDETELNTHNVRLTVPPQQRPVRWHGAVNLRLENHPEVQPVQIHIEGYAGGSLHPRPSKLVLSGDGPAQTTIRMIRKHPPATPGTHAPLRTNPSTIEIEENYDTADTSTVTLKFPNSFIQKLKKEKRIPIQIQAEGCLPATLTVEHSP